MSYLFYLFLQVRSGIECAAYCTLINCTLFSVETDYFNRGRECRLDVGNGGSVITETGAFLYGKP